MGRRWGEEELRVLSATNGLQRVDAETERCGALPHPVGVFLLLLLLLHQLQRLPQLRHLRLQRFGSAAERPLRLLQRHA